MTMYDNKEIRKIFAVPHFHYDVEWWKTESGYNVDVEMIIEKALGFLEQRPQFKYAIDSALALRPYWEKHPEKHGLIRKFISENRLELIGGTFCAPDEHIPTGEAFARQFLYGKRFLEGVVGGKVVCAWEIDEFGHPAQTPQIVKRCGMESYTFSRGLVDWDDPDRPMHFYWEAPDGTRVLTNWFAALYTTMMPLLKNPGINRRLFKKDMIERVKYETRRAQAPFLMMPVGSDFTEPVEEWLDIIDDWNRHNSVPAVFSLPREFFAELAKCELPTCSGDMIRGLDGTWESRERVKRLCRKTQFGILDAEKLSSFAHSLGATWPAAQLDEAWENILENDFHDIICGTGTDNVYRNTIKRYDTAAANIDAVARAAVDSIAGHVDTAVDAMPVMVFNTLNWQRRDIARVKIADLNVNSWGGWTVKGPDGDETPCQVMGDELLFVADVPPMGYAVYSVVAGSASSQCRKKTGVKLAGLTMENEYFRVTMDPASGGISSIIDKETGLECVDTSAFSANEIVVEEDAGNLWTIQKTGDEWRARKFKSTVAYYANGPVCAGFESAGGHDSLARIQRVFLYSGVRRIDFETIIDFKGRDRRVLVKFQPRLSGKPQNHVETPFYTETKRDGHWCAQTWAAIGDGKHGLALLNSGNPGHDFNDGVLGMALMRSVSVVTPAVLKFVARNLLGLMKTASKYAGMTIRDGFNLQRMEVAFYDYHGLSLREWSAAGGPPDDNTGFNLSDHLKAFLKFDNVADCWERGRHDFRYSAVPFSGEWKTAKLARQGLEFNCPLFAQVVPSSEGELPRIHSFVSNSGDDDIVMVALKKAEFASGYVARLFNPNGEACDVNLGLTGGMKACEKTNMTEDGDFETIAVRKGVAKVAVKPWEIVTVRVDMENQ